MRHQKTRLTGAGSTGTTNATYSVRCAAAAPATRAGGRRCCRVRVSDAATLAAGARGSVGTVTVCVPTSALEVKRTHGNQLAHLSATFRTGCDRRIGYTLLHFKYLLTLLTLILIHRHHSTSSFSRKRINHLKKRKQRPIMGLCSLLICHHKTGRRTCQRLAHSRPSPKPGTIPPKTNKTPYQVRESSKKQTIPLGRAI